MGARQVTREERDELRCLWASMLEDNPYQTPPIADERFLSLLDALDSADREIAALAMQVRALAAYSRRQFDAETAFFEEHASRLEERAAHAATIAALADAEARMAYCRECSAGPGERCAGGVTHARRMLT